MSRLRNEEVVTFLYAHHRYGERVVRENHILDVAGYGGGGWL